MNATIPPREPLTTEAPPITKTRMGTRDAGPAWWEFQNAGTCRQSSLSISGTPPPPAVSCTDWSAGNASMNIATYTIGAFGPSTVSMKAFGAVTAAHLADLSAGQEYLSARFGINHAKTVGA